MSRAWIPKTFDQVCKRAAGRRRYHAQRRRERDNRQLAIMGVLVQTKWQHYGMGRALAEALSVDPATISRDIRDILRWRKALIKGVELSDEFADAVIQRLIAKRIHPRHGYTWTYLYKNGASSLTVRRGYTYAPGLHPRHAKRSTRKS